MALRAMSGARAALNMIRFCICVRFCAVWLQAPGFGHGEAFTDKTFTGVARLERSYNIELEEMEVFAVSGYL